MYPGIDLNNPSCCSNITNLPWTLPRRFPKPSFLPRIGAWCSLRLHTVLRRHLSTVFEVAFSADGRHLASCGIDQVAVVWDTGDWTERQVLRGHRDETWTVRFSPDGRHVDTGSKDGTLRVWNPDSPADRAPVHLPTTSRSATDADWWSPFDNGDLFLHSLRGDYRHMPGLELWNRDPFVPGTTYGLATNFYLAQLSLGGSHLAFARDDS